MNPEPPSFLLPSPPGRKKKSFYPLPLLLLLFFTGGAGCLILAGIRVSGGEEFYHMQRQIFYLGLGFLLAITASFIPFRFFLRGAGLFLFLSLAGLLGVLMFGKRINGMRGWFEIGDLCLIQVSEFAKCAFILYGSRLLAQEKGKYLSGQTFTLFLLLTGTIIFLLLKEPDYGGAIMFFASFLFLSIARGVKKRHLLPALLLMGLATLFFILRNSYAFNRLYSFFLQEEGLNASWHLQQFRYTLAQGGWTGTEWGSPLWTGAYLPFPHTDSLFAALVEMTGFAGGALLILLYTASGVAFTFMSWHIPSSAGKLFVFTFGALLLFHALLHIGVNILLLPPTGVTLPFLSFGGSSLSALMLSCGIVFSAAADQ